MKLMRVSCVLFCARNLIQQEVEGKRIVEIGAIDVNGSMRPLIESWRPSEYLGIDIEHGKSVDVVFSAEDLEMRFGRETFDVVMSIDMLEHAANWKAVISNMKRVCKPGGVMMITTCSQGFPYHAYPHDYWRYEMEDFETIFSDCEILGKEEQPEDWGVFFKIRKPCTFVEKDLTDYALFSVVANQRVTKLVPAHFRSLRYKRIVMAGFLRSIYFALAHSFYRRLTK
jgi:SAM-dependent methyltransferase